jgi:hypothetical protein
MGIRRGSSKSARQALRAVGLDKNSGLFICNRLRKAARAGGNGWNAVCRCLDHKGHQHIQAAINGIFLA